MYGIQTLSVEQIHWNYLSNGLELQLQEPFNNKIINHLSEDPIKGNNTLILVEVNQIVITSKWKLCSHK